MNTFDDKFGKGSLDKLRDAASIEGWENATIIESSIPGHLFLNWEGTKGTAEAIITWLPNKNIEWHNMTVDPPRSGFASALTISFVPVLHEIGVIDMVILGGGDGAFAAIGFEEVYNEHYHSLQWTMPTARGIEYAEFKEGKATPKWRNEE